MYKRQPYELHYFGLDAVVDFDDNLFAGKNVLVIHQQAAASAMAAMAEEAGAARVMTASWFMDKPEARYENHVVLKEEDDLRDLAAVSYTHLWAMFLKVSLARLLM